MEEIAKEKDASEETSEESDATDVEEEEKEEETLQTLWHSLVDSNGSSHSPMAHCPAMQQMPAWSDVEDAEADVTEALESTDASDCPDAGDLPEETVPDAPLEADPTTQYA